MLHFEKYLASEEPVAVSLKALSGVLVDAWVRRDNDTLGEFVLFHMLKAFLSEERAREASQGWGGDRYAYYEDEADRQLLAISTRWDTERDGIQFFNAYVSFVETKGQGALPQLSTKPNLRLWSSADQRVVGLQLEGNAVSVVLSPNIILAVEVLAGL
jgi:hypothetical protein